MSIKINANQILLKDDHGSYVGIDAFVKGSGDPDYGVDDQARAGIATLNERLEDIDDNLIITSDEQPTHESNRVWVNPYAPEVELATEEELNAVVDRVDELERKPVTDQSLKRRVENLEAAANGFLYREEVDSTEAYSKTVPSGVLPNATLDSYGGKSIVWNQVFNGTEKVSGFGANVKVVENEDGTYTGTIEQKPTNVAGNYNCTAKISVSRIVGNVYAQIYRIKVSKDAKVFSVKNNDWTSGVTVPADGTFHRVTAVTSNFVDNYPFYMGFTAVQNNENLQVGDWYTVKDWMCFDLTEMFGAGNEPTREQFGAMFPDDYYPYAPGEIISAGVSELEAKGKNILDASADTLRYYRSGSYTSFNLNNGVVETTGSSLFGFLVPVEKHKNYTASISIDNPVQSGQFRIWGVNSFFEGTFDGNTTGIIASKSIGSTSAFKDMALEFIPETDYVLVGLYIPEAGAGMVFRNFMLRLTDTPSDYTPHKESSVIAIPDAITSLPCYGCSAGSVCNEVDLENRQYIQRVSSVDLGALTWKSTTLNRLYSTELRDLIKIPAPANNVANVICSTLTAATSADVSENINNNIIGIVSNGNIAVYSQDYVENPSGFKEAMSGVVLYYELSEPIITDISDLLPDNALEVEAGGTVTFKNALGDSFRVQIPNQVSYLINLQEAIANG